MKKSVLLLKNLKKEKAGSRILNHFFLEIFSGEIVNLIGLEGSGKEEIYAILFGEDAPDGGEISFAGRRCASGQEIPVESANGIFFIGNQELLIPDLSVAENMYIVEKLNYFQFSVSKRKMELQARRILSDFHVEIDPGEKAKNLNRYEGYLIRLMRAYLKRAKLIVVDDILDDCSYEHIGQIIEILGRFKAEGISILWINSYPDVISEAADRTVVIHDGRDSCTFYRDEFDRDSIMKALMQWDASGKPAGEETVEEGSQKTEKETVFRMEKVANDYFHGVSFACGQGEILGIYDLQNRFSRELQKLLLGQCGYTGSLLLEGKPFHAEAEYKLIQNRVGVIDGTKYQSLVFRELSVTENIEMAVYRKTAKAGCLVNQRIKRYLDKIGAEICENNGLSRLSPYVSRRDAMQIIYSRWGLSNPKVLFCFQPFLRLDAVSRKQLEEIFKEFRQRGMGIVLSSVRRSELTPLCDRILVAENNRIIREIYRKEFSEHFQS